MQGKYVRICWNTSGWRYPTGDAPNAEVGKSFVNLHGFGHEEWLFNFEWKLGSHKFGFTQPIGKYHSTYAGQDCAIVLYTVPPKSGPVFVGKINLVHVLTEEEARIAAYEFEKRGWLNLMREDVRRINGDMRALDEPRPFAILNMRFRQEDVQLFDPWIDIPDDHELRQNRHRYHPYNWAGDTPARSKVRRSLNPADPRRSEHERVRAAQEGTTYNPQHVRLQNRLFELLKRENPGAEVSYENDRVDLIVANSEQTIYFEVKIKNTVKACVREALGQLLEYAMYPAARRATELRVVGDVEPTPDDRSYLAHLRATLGMPITYSRFDWQSQRLQPPI
jgi:hypothetical protein